MAWIKKRTTAKGDVRYDVEYRDPAGQFRSKTFRRRRDAETFQRNVETEVADGSWIDPQAGKITLADYSRRWLKSRAKLTARTKELYEGQLRLHILPALGSVSLNRLTPALVREWHGSLFDRPARRGKRPIGPNTIAKCYRLLHVICETAVADELIRRNPCKVENAGKEEHDERPTATVVEVFALADQVRPERRALVLLAAFSGLRLGELLALRRRHVDVLHKRIIVQESTVELRRGKLVTKGPKSQAGKRRVHLDAVVFDEVRRHLKEHTAAAPDSYLFTGAKGSQLRRAVWHKEWNEARRALALTHLRFHDLRHTHGTLVAQEGGSVKETMRRLGQSTVQAAMIYQHATDDRDRAIAETIGDRIKRELEKAEEKRKRRESGEAAG